jgi:predicted dehydrogenase
MMKMKPANSREVNRRDFIKKSSMGLGGVLLAPTILPSTVKWRGANNRMLVGHIGVGQRGTAELRNYFLKLEGSRSVAVCDVFRNRRQEGVELIQSYYSANGISAPECKPYLDFEELLMRDDIDAVHITTSDHWHVLGAIKAARAGKHIMLAKPLGLSYPNYLILQGELKKHDVHFHYGTQQRSMKHMELGIDMIKAGKIGDIERVDVWAPGKNPVSSPICKEVPVPEDFDFERWSGPAPLNSYCPERVTNNSSWFQYDYSIGFLAGWGAHPLDILVWGIKDKIDGAYSSKGTGTFWQEGGMYDNIYSWDISYSYKSGIEVHFLSTDRAEKELLNHRTRKEGNGTTFYGTKGWISLSRNSGESNIPKLNKKINDFPKDGNGQIMSEENTMGQMFLDVAQGKRDETCPLDDAIISDTISHMGDIAIRSKREVSWDPKKGKVVDDEAANNLFIREMREPYMP